MTNRTFWDEEFNELNSIELSGDQKNKLWKNITAKKKKNRWMFFKNGLIYAAAIAIFLVLTMSFLSEKIQTKNHSASDPVKPVKIEPAQLLYQKDSADWEIVDRERYDLAIIEKIQIDENKVSITAKRIQTYGTDADPLGPVIKRDPPTETVTYLLKTSEPKQTLHLEKNQNVLLKFSYYLPKGAADSVLAAEVLGAAKDDGKLYNSSGELLNFPISSQVKVIDGKIVE
jgi:hypothetical protein